MDFTNVFYDFAGMKLVNLSVSSFMKYERYATFWIGQDLALLIVRGQLTKTMFLRLV